MRKSFSELQKDYKRLSRIYGTQAIFVDDARSLHIGSVIIPERRLKESFAWILEPVRLGLGWVKYKEEWPDCKMKYHKDAPRSVPKWTARWIAKRDGERYVVIIKKDG